MGAVAGTERRERTGVELGADVVLRALEESGVEVCFGMPGGAILPIYDALARGTSIRHVLVRHEQGAGHMAQGYARASGRPGVVFATSGPGATNLVTPIADAQMDSTPLVCITGQVRWASIGTDAFQECDITGITMPIVKHSWLVESVDNLRAITREAIALACAGRPGPVLIDIPRDVQEAPVRSEPPVAVARFDTSARWSPEGSPVDDVTRALAVASAPVLYVGGGAQGAAAEVRALAERADVPVVTTLMGKGAFPESHPLFIGWPGMHGNRAANLALHHADVILAAGARFDDRVTGRVDTFAPAARIIHVDVDPYEHGKVRSPDIALCGTLADVLPRLTARVPPAVADRAAWHEQLAAWACRYPLRFEDDGPALSAQTAIRVLSDATADREVIWTTGVGQHQMWAMQHVAVQAPRSFITSGGHGTMGFGLPAAIGARTARPDTSVVCIDGDGSFQMTLQELATSVAEDLPVVVVIINNGQLGMVHQWQTMFHDQRLSQVDLSHAQPDFAAIARGFGALGFTVGNASALSAAFAEALHASKTAVIDVHVSRNEACFPMIPPGGSAAEQLEYRPGR